MSSGETVYIKADMNTVVFKRSVTMEDVLKIECTDVGMLRKIKQKKIYSFPNNTNSKNQSSKNQSSKNQSSKNQTEVFSILKIIELIHEDYPSATVVNIGETDFVVEYNSGENASPLWEKVRLVLVCVLVFLGAAFTIMAFNNDISVSDLFSKFYQQVMGVEKPEVSELEIFYCIGMAVGILVFFNHFGKKKITSDPTPIQVEMRKYEQDVNTTLIENASRKGHNEDVD